MVEQALLAAQEQLFVLRIRDYIKRNGYLQMSDFGLKKELRMPLQVASEVYQGSRVYKKFVVAHADDFVLSDSGHVVYLRVTRQYMEGYVVFSDLRGASQSDESSEGYAIEDSLNCIAFYTRQGQMIVEVEDETIEIPEGSIFALDFEWDAESDTEICLAQLGLSDSLGLLIDPLSCEAGVRKEVLHHTLKLFAQKSLYLLVHDCHADVRALGETTSMALISKLLDTQLVYEYLTGDPLGGLNKYLSLMNVDEHQSKSDMHRRMDSNRRFWSARPLDDEKLQYAAADAMLLQQTAAELVSRLSASQLATIQCATQQRIRDSIRTQGKRSMCFDVANRCRLASSEAKAWLGAQPAAPVDEAAETGMVCDLEPLLELLPDHFRDGYLVEHEDELEETLLELVLDLGRRPYAQLLNGKREFLVEDDASVLVEHAHLEAFVAGLPWAFGSDNRAGIDRQLHRISAIRNRSDAVIGLTMRVGRFFPGNAFFLSDLLLHPDYADQSILVLGPPGSGKTSVVREIARVLAERQSVVVVDTSNEICGAGDIPHACVGHARRMMVKDVGAQHRVMIECVQNHTPRVMIIDEISSSVEARAARTCKARGVRMVASAHGDFRGLLVNEDLKGLLGGTMQVIYSDRVAKAEKKGSKVGLERVHQPTFDVICGSAQEGLWRVQDHSWRGAGGR